eukprot:6067989-Prymnesium_polylepis.1
MRSRRKKGGGAEEELAVCFASRMSCFVCSVRRPLARRASAAQPHVNFACEVNVVVWVEGVWFCSIRTGCDHSRNIAQVSILLIYRESLVYRAGDLTGYKK